MPKYFAAQIPELMNLKGFEQHALILPHERLQIPFGTSLKTASEQPLLPLVLEAFLKHLALKAAAASSDKATIASA